MFVLIFFFIAGAPIIEANDAGKVSYWIFLVVNFLRAKLLNEVRFIIYFNNYELPS